MRAAARHLSTSTLADGEVFLPQNYFGFKTLERSYLLRIDGHVAERPQHMLMRVAVGIHGSNIDAAIETYNLMSERYFTHASPTLFNAGTPHPQLSSCFLVSMRDDSIEGIYDVRIFHALPTCFSSPVVLSVLDSEAMCTNFQDCWRYWSQHPQHPCYWLLHCRHQRLLQRHRSHAESV